MTSDNVVTSETKLELIHEPGRIDTLTSDEEQKLKDMWAQLLSYTGVLPKDLKSAPSSLSTHSAEKKKKKRSYFGFRKVEEPENEWDSEAKSLKEALKGVSGEDLNTAFFVMIKADHPDNLLLRFLRARKWDVKAALHMIGDTLAWRLQNDFDDILRTGEMGEGEDHEEFLLQLRSKKSYIWGNDFRGRPIVHVKPCHHDPKSQKLETVEKYTLFIIESARLCLKDPVDTAAVFFDMTNFSLSNMDNGAVKFIIQCFEGHFPESLGVLLIHKAPWVFSGIWSIIKGWIDPVVVSKIHFTNTPEDLVKFIPMEYIEKDLGGESDHSFEYIEAVEGENDLLKASTAKDELSKARDALTNEFLEATVQWIKSESKEENKKSQERKNQVAKQLHENYWLIDPYIRARSVFDRNGSMDKFAKLHLENWK